MGLRRSLTGLVAASIAVLALLVDSVGAPDTGGARAEAANAVALHWTGAETADAPRWDGDGWEVDVRRANGSLVEVKIGPELELRDLDEEVGPAGGPARDELTGAARRRAIAAARAALGVGSIRGVERERDGTIEVDLVVSARTVVEVELDARYRIRDIDEEDIADE